MKRAALLTLCACVLAGSARAEPPPDDDARVVTVRVLVDEEFRARPKWRVELDNDIGLASRVLEASVGIRLEVDEVEPWQSPDDALHVPALHEELDGLDPGGADLLLGWSAQQGPEGLNAYTYDHLGMAEFYGDTVIVRVPTRLESLFWNVAASVLVHEMGHVFGAWHCADERSVMTAVQTTEVTWAFDAANRAAILAMRDLELGCDLDDLPEDAWRAAAAAYASDPPTHVTFPLAEVLEDQLDTEDFTEARTRARTGLLVSITEHAYGERSWRLSEPLALRALASLLAGDLESAERDARSAVASAHGHEEDAPLHDTAFSWAMLGRVLGEDDRAEEARTAFERALSTYDLVESPDPLWCGYALAWLAHDLRSNAPDRARLLARRAVDLYQCDPDRYEDDLAYVRGLLEDLGPGPVAVSRGDAEVSVRPSVAMDEEPALASGVFHWPAPSTWHLRTARQEVAVDPDVRSAVRILVTIEVATRDVRTLRLAARTANGDAEADELWSVDLAVEPREITSLTLGTLVAPGGSPVRSSVHVRHGGEHAVHGPPPVRAGELAEVRPEHFRVTSPSFARLPEDGGEPVIVARQRLHAPGDTPPTELTWTLSVR